MKKTQSLFLGLGLIVSASDLSAQGSAFTYQGRLTDNGSPATGLYDFQFGVYGGAAGGEALSPVVNSTGVFVMNGLFTTTLDFGGAFNGGGRWLQIAVRTNGSLSTPNMLNPRQALTPSPYAITAANLSGNVSDPQLSVNIPRLDANETFTGTANFNPAVGAPFAVGNTTKVSNLNADLLDGLDSAAFWKIGGNSGTTSGVNFVGTTDDQPLEFKVNGLRALRLEFAGDSGADPDSLPDGAPNLIGGAPVNFVAAGVVGATIAGGGATNYYGSSSPNRVSAIFGTIGGGRDNWVAADHSIIGGGYLNRIETNAYDSVIGGGVANVIQSNAYPGGTIAGGTYNTIQLSTAGGTIGGGYANLIGFNSSYPTIGGGYVNTIQAYAYYATISGGYLNTIGADSYYSTISGGSGNNVQANARTSTIGGGANNLISVGSFRATIAGGLQNEIGNDAPHATISGGATNTILANADSATIGGGHLNTNTGAFATVPGGTENAATNYAFAAGRRAKANHSGAFVWADSTDADFASGASDEFAIRARGGARLSEDTPALSFGNQTRQMLNLFGTNYGIGVQMNTTYFRSHNNFAWFKDGSHVDAANTAGGPDGLVLMRLDNTGSLYTMGAVNPPSDRNLKAGFAPVDAKEILRKVAALPITRWHYTNDAATPHLGPVAQDFYAAFQVGPDDKHIATVDESGVALAAIQGLHQLLEAKDAQMRMQQTKLETLEARLALLEKRLTTPSAAK